MVLLETAPITIKNDDGVMEIYKLEFIEIAETKNSQNEYLYKFIRTTGETEYSFKIKLTIGEVGNILRQPQRYFDYLLKKFYHQRCYRIQIRFNKDFTDYMHGLEEINSERTIMRYHESCVEKSFDKDINQTDSFDFSGFATNTPIYEVIIWMKEDESVAEVIPEIKRLILEYEDSQKKDNE